jgi:hypothetical protein
VVQGSGRIEVIMSKGLFGSYASITFDGPRFTRYIKERLRDILKVGITAWVEEAKSRIPVWSGASRAALTQIAGFVGVPVFGPGKGTGTVHSDSPVSHAPNREGDGAASENFEVDINGASGKVLFRWSSSLFHLNVNERVNVNELHHHFNLIQPGPYELRKHCNDAFKRAADEEMRRFQFRIRQFVKTRRIKVGG